MQKLDDLVRFVQFESVSTVAKYKPEIAKTAAWLRERFEELGMASRVMKTAGNPVVFAELRASSGAPTVLVYGHYDVQPAEPASEWSAPPFSGVIKDGAIWGRGTSDNKGQMWCHVLALEEYRAQGKKVPVNLKFLVEGEEEIGSPSLEAFIKENRKLLACDVAWISDGSIAPSGAPTIDAGLRGFLGAELHVAGPDRDLHSGSYGGAVANPAAVAARVVASMIGPDETVTIKGFYDSVREISPAVAKALAKEPFDEHEFLKITGAPALAGEPGYSTQERIGLRPTLQVTGLSSGYTGEGIKNIVPKDAVVKLNFRLVHGQEWRGVKTLVKKHIAAVIPEGVTWKFKIEMGSNAFLMDPEAPVIRKAAKVFAAAFGKETVVRFEGGSLPVAEHFATYLTPHVLLSGWAQEMHGVDEKLDLALIERGTKAVSTYWQALAR